jgi:nitrite reductase (NADH) small subunit
MPWKKLCDYADLKNGEAKYVEINGTGYAVFLHNDHVFTIDNYCPHAGGNLAGGWIDSSDPTIPPCAVCPWHGWAFRLDNGELRDSPAVKVGRYESRVVNGIVEADLPGL